jgi:peptide/nickel transport system permease protein
MSRYIITRFVMAIVVVWLVSGVAFGLMELTPGDPAQAVAPPGATAAQIDGIRHQLGLDKPFGERYVTFITGVVQGDFGRSASLRPGSSAWSVVWEAVPVTFSLTLVTMFFAVLLGVPAGIAAAVRRGTWVDTGLTSVASVLIAVPAFVIGPVLVIVLALNRSWLPAVGYAPLADGFGEWFSHLVLPAIALGLAPAAELARQLRGSLVTILDSAYVRTARAKGASEVRVIGKHALKNAGIPAVTVLGLQVSRVVGGAVIVEAIFAMPGLGSLTLSAILVQDLPVLQTIVILSATVVVTVNLLVDLSYGYFNPKLVQAGRA